MKKEKTTFQERDLRKRLNRALKKKSELNNRIMKAINYLKEHSLYEQDYDFDYEENLVEYPPSDEQARKDLLDILKGSDKE